MASANPKWVRARVQTGAGPLGVDKLQHIAFPVQMPEFGRNRSGRRLRRRGRRGPVGVNVGVGVGARVGVGVGTGVKVGVGDATAAAGAGGGRVTVGVGAVVGVGTSVATGRCSGGAVAGGGASVGGTAVGGIAAMTAVDALAVGRDSEAACVACTLATTASIVAAKSGWVGVGVAGSAPPRKQPTAAAISSRTAKIAGVYRIIRAPL